MKMKKGGRKSSSKLNCMKMWSRNTLIHGANRVKAVESCKEPQNNVWHSCWTGCSKQILIVLFFLQLYFFLFFFLIFNCVLCEEVTHQYLRIWVWLLGYKLHLILSCVIPSSPAALAMGLSFTDQPWSVFPFKNICLIKELSLKKKKIKNCNAAVQNKEKYLFFDPIITGFVYGSVN